MIQRFRICLVGFLLTWHLSGTSQIIKVDSTTNWKRSFKAGLNLNQASFSSNWKGGGVSSFGFNALMNYKANYQKDRKSWTNELDMLYGMINNQGQGYRKTMDRLYFDTKYGYQLSDKWDMFFAMNFLSQFAKGYKYVKDAAGVEQAFLISDLLAPAFVTSSLGFEYHPADYFKLRLAPLAPRLTVVNHSERYLYVDSIAPYGVKVGSNRRLEWAAFQALAEFNKNLTDNVNLTWRYMMYANYQTLEAKKIDHRLDLNITATITKFINVSIGGILLYDYDQVHSVQLSQAFSLGILYSFQNYAKEE